MPLKLDAEAPTGTPLQVGLAAHNAIVALVLADAGLPGATQPLEGRLGYYAMYAEPGSDVDGIELDLASPGETIVTTQEMGRRIVEAVATV